MGKKAERCLMKKLIKNVRIVLPYGIIENGVCLTDNGIIQYVGKDCMSAERVIDGGGNYLIPGFIDLHCHGGCGFEFMDADMHGVEKISEFHLSHGTTTMLVTTLAADQKETIHVLDTFEQYKYKNPESNLLGVHLEGPWLNPDECGAQNAEYMESPNVEKLLQLKKKYPFILRVSAAPELSGGQEFGKAGQDAGIVMSIAHTAADFSEVEKAHINGYTLMTHLYSGMRTVTRKNAFRVAGAVEAGLYLDTMYAEIIADGRHLPEELLKYIYKIKGKDKLCLITDAIRAAGLPEGTKTVIGSLERGLPVIVEDEVAKLMDRKSFAGSTATFDRLYKTMASAIGRDLPALSQMASTTPAKIMGLTDRGEIKAGKLAHLLMLDENLNITKIIYGEREL